MVSPDEIQYVRSKSEYLPSECLKGRKHSSQSVRLMVSVAVSELGKTDLVLCSQELK